jgi:hypothetical protein
MEMLFIIGLGLACLYGLAFFVTALLAVVDNFLETIDTQRQIQEALEYRIIS